jgi:hypothetical protein
LKLRLALAALLTSLSAQAAEPQHGKTDVFAAPGLRLAWAIERGADESKTFVVIRVAHDTGIHRHFTATGRDPFTKAEREWKTVALSTGRAEVRIPRSLIGDFAHTELRFYSGTPGAKPQLAVLYYGVPDTAPEFDDRARLDKYLDERIAEARPR